MDQPLELTLARQLVEIPSFVDDAHNEVALADFLCIWASEHIPKLVIQKQFLSDGSGRYNVILRGRAEPKLFVLGHMDTVQIHSGWNTNPLKPIIQGDRLYGLGSADMKGSIAAFLTALSQKSEAVNLDGLYVLLYVDEEYDFAGIKLFLERMDRPFAPALVISLDGETDISAGCRGLIEISFKVNGQAGHAADPANGRNAITGAIDIVRAVGEGLVEFSDTILGPSTSNVSDLHAGSGQGNIIPDVASVNFEVRPATPSLTAKVIQKRLETEAAQRQFGITDVSIRHDIAPWSADFDTPEFRTIERLYKDAGIPFRIFERRFQGYIDVQMLTQRITSPTYIIGVTGANKHAPNESMGVQVLTQAVVLYKAILREFLPTV